VRAKIRGERIKTESTMVRRTRFHRGKVVQMPDVHVAAKEGACAFIGDILSVRVPGRRTEDARSTGHGR
jgi:hypothetical protein